MVIKKRQILWDWTNSAGPGNPGVPGKLDQVGFGANSPVASLINWNAWVPPELKGRVPFRPMVRDMSTTSGNDWNIIQNNNFPIILFFNEPERHGITPEKAKDIWVKQMLPLRKNKGRKLGSPAVASDENGRKWIEKFMSLVGNDKPDYLCLHYYSTNADEAIKYITNMHNKWNKIPVMVTEIACIDRNYQNVLKFTVKVVNWMDKQSWIAEYGLFDFQRKVADDFVSPAAQLMDANGNFTELGKKYCKEQPMKGPGGQTFMAESVDGEEAAVGVQSLTAEAESSSEASATADNADEVASSPPTEGDETANVAEASVAEAPAAEEAAFSTAAALGPGIQLTNKSSKKHRYYFYDNYWNGNGTAGANFDHPLKNVEVGPNATVFVPLDVKFKGRVQRGDQIPCTWGEFQVKASNDGKAHGDISLQQGCDGAATVASTDGTKVSNGFTQDIVKGAPAAALDKKPNGEKVLASTEGNWIHPKGNQAAIDYEYKVLGHGKAYIKGGTGVPDIASKNNCLHFTFYVVN
ncbi:hypothetical protein PG987_014649 [Apiospora arundinis]